MLIMHIGCEPVITDELQSWIVVLWSSPDLCLPTGTVLGDPHFITFDGSVYTFNGRGEYYLLSSPDKGLVVQGRTEPVKLENGGSLSLQSKRWVSSHQPHTSLGDLGPLCGCEKPKRLGQALWWEGQGLGEDLKFTVVLDNTIANTVSQSQER